MLDGYEVNEGDRVWDISHKWGTVTRVNTDGTFRVSFSGHSQTYQSGGTSGISRARCLYWNDPVIFPPAPGPLGEVEIKAVKSFLEFFRSARRLEGGDA